MLQFSPLRALRAIAAAAGFIYIYLTAIYLTLPDVRPLAVQNPETTAFIEMRVRQARARAETPRRIQHWVPLGRISPNLTRAVLIAEDSAFYQHEGIDIEQIQESLERNYERWELARGASTITQQLAKNLYLSPSKNPIRKFRELLIARLLEGALNKRRIFELYLNVIEWGDGVYGADAAARAYFGVPASGLSAHQAALLAGAIINPRAHNPGAPSRRLVARQRLILSRMGRRAAPPSIPLDETERALRELFPPDEPVPVVDPPVDPVDDPPAAPKPHPFPDPHTERDVRPPRP